MPIVEITLIEGRSLEKKAALMKAVTAAIADSIGRGGANHHPRDPAGAFRRRRRRQGQNRRISPPGRRARPKPLTRNRARQQSPDQQGP